MELVRINNNNMLLWLWYKLAMMTVFCSSQTWSQYDFRFQCGAASIDVPKVIGGSDVKVHEIPWQAYLEIQNHNLPDLLRCGGVLVDEAVVLTAAHCVTGAKNIKVILGAHDLSAENETKTLVVAAKEFRIHPAFGVRTRYEMDAAVIFLARRVDWNLYPNVRPICLPPGGNIDGFTNRPAMISGWGIKLAGKKASILQKGDVMVLPPERCSDGSIYSEQFTESMLCAGVADGSVDACAGDSGGPLVSKERTGSHYELLGLVSWGKGCGRAGFPGVYTKISAIYDWLIQILQETGRLPEVSNAVRPDRESGIRPTTKTTEKETAEGDDIFSETGRLAAENVKNAVKIAGKVGKISFKIVKKLTTNVTEQETESAEGDDGHSATGRLAVENVKEHVCEVCNFFHSFVNTLLKPKS